MIHLGRILKDYRESGAMSALLPVHLALEDHMFLTKSGHLVTIIQIRGADYECLDPNQLDQISRRFESAVRTLDENTRLYQYLVKRNQPAIPAGRYEDAVVQEAISDRMAYLQAKTGDLYSMEIFFAVVFEAWAAAPNSRRGLMDRAQDAVAKIRPLLSDRCQSQTLNQELNRLRTVFADKIATFLLQFPESVHGEILDKHRGFQFLRSLANYRPDIAGGATLKYDRFVDFQTCDSSLECHRDHLRLDDHYVEVLSLKEPPSHTFAHSLRALQEVPSNFIIASEWKRENDLKVRKLIQSKRRHFHNSKSSLMNYLPTGSQSRPTDVLTDNSAVALVDDLGSCLEAIEVQGRYFGQFSLTVVLYDEDRSRVRRAAAEFWKIFATCDARVIEERYNLLNAWLAIHPGNSHYNLRRLWLVDRNYADFSFLFALHPGEIHNTHLNSEYAAVLEDNHGAPYFLNLHRQDVAHTVILGGTGSGKSFFLNFLLTHLQKYTPFTYVFDLGGSYESLTTLFGGTYVPVGTEQRSFTINPFALPLSRENLQFLFSFLKVLLESSAYQMTADDERDLFDQIENVYVLEPAQRRLLTLSNMLNRRLRGPLQRWVQGGQYETFFDNSEDNLSFARFQAFDFEGMHKLPQVLEPLLFYILHRANAAICGPEATTTFKIFVVDEAWQFFRHPTIQRYIVEALKTWRKKNGAMVLATQSSDDLLRSEMLRVVVESCATKIFLANPEIDRAFFREVFHLNHTESEWIARLLPKKQILVKRADAARIVNLNVGPKDYWLYTSNPYDRRRRQEAFDRYGFKQGLEILARSHSS